MVVALQSVSFVLLAKVSHVENVFVKTQSFQVMRVHVPLQASCSRKKQASQNLVVISLQY